MSDQQKKAGARRRAALAKLTKSEPPAQFKTDDELTVEDQLSMIQGGARPETDAYKDHRRLAATAAGIDPDDADPADLAAWSPDDHLKAIRTNRH